MCPQVIGSSQKTNSEEAKILLFLIGVNSYADKNIENLKHCCNDCLELGESLEALETSTQFQKKEIIIHYDPVKEEVIKSLEKFGDLKPQDTVIFYFSGHGFLEDETKEPILGLANTEKAKLAETGLKVKTLLEQLAGCKAKRQLVLLDACHSGAVYTENFTPQLITILEKTAENSQNNNQGFYAILSCDKDQKSLEFDELKHGLFTYHLIRGIGGEAADNINNKRVIEADRLYNYVYRETIRYIDNSNQNLEFINQQRRSSNNNKETQKYSWQEPVRIVAGKGEFVLGLSPEKQAGKSKRKALVIDGLSDLNTTNDISKILNEKGGFNLDFYNTNKRPEGDELYSKISTFFHSKTTDIVLLYLRAKIKPVEGINRLILGDNLSLDLNFLIEQINSSQIDQRIIIFDLTGNFTEKTNINQWFQDRENSEQSKCIIIASSSVEGSTEFSQKLLEVLKEVNLEMGLTVVQLITKLQRSLDSNSVENENQNIKFYPLLSGITGVTNVLLPTKENSDNSKENSEYKSNICPYKGLNAFTKEDAPFFFGREKLKKEIIEKITTTSFLAVVGDSGSGKSSVVQAGVLPYLEEHNFSWFSFKQTPIENKNQLENKNQRLWSRSFRPGNNPINSLAIALSNTQEERDYLEGILYDGVNKFIGWLRQQKNPMLVVVIDQFEELFTQTAQDERQKFLNLVLGAIEYASDRFKLIITLRSDFISSCLEIPKLATWLNQSHILVSPWLSEEEYREIIVKPAESVKLSVESELVNTLLKDIKDFDVSLPLPILEFVLEQLWEYRSEKRSLTLEAYQNRIGGIRGVLEKKANDTYEKFSDEEKECAKFIFLSLVNLGEGKEDTRRRLFQSELITSKYGEHLIQSTINKLVDAKLIVASPHQELGQVRSRGDNDSENDSSDEEKQVFSEATDLTIEIAHEILIRNWSQLRLWLDKNRQRLRIMREIEQDVKKWRNNQKTDDYLLRGAALAQAEDLYLQYSDELSLDMKEFIEAGVKERDRLLEEQKERRRRAEVNEIIALCKSSSALLASNQQLEALIEAIKAGQKQQRLNRVEAESFTLVVKTLQKVLYKIKEYNRLEAHLGGVNKISISPKGNIIATAGLSDTTVKLWSSDGQLLQKVIGGYHVAFSPRGEIAIAIINRTLLLWDLHNNSKRIINSGFVSALAFSANGQMMATAYSNEVKLWKLEDGSLVNTLEMHENNLMTVGFSPDSQKIVSGGWFGSLYLWELDGTLITSQQTGAGSLNSASFSPDGEMIATGSNNGTVTLWSSNGTLVKTFQAHIDTIWELSFSPDSNIIATVSGDETVKLWNTDGTLLRTLLGHRSVVRAVSFSANGMIATGDDEGIVKLWKLGGTNLKILDGHIENVYTVRYSPNGERIASTHGHGKVSLWSSDGTLLETKSWHHGPISTFEWSPNGEKIITAAGDRHVKLWNSDGTWITSLQGHSGDQHHPEVLAVSFRFDSMRFATASFNGIVEVWDLNGGLLNTLQAHNNVVRGVSLSQDGNYLASVGDDKTIKIWEMENGTLQTTLPENPENESQAVSVAFSPSSNNILATGHIDGKVNIWNIDGQLLRTFEAHTTVVRVVKFSPDGKMLATGSYDNTVKIWTEDGTEIKNINLHEAQINSLDFSPDGKILASASKDKTVILSNLETVLNLDELITYGCEWVRGYLKNNLKVEQSDKNLCD